MTKFQKIGIGLIAVFGLIWLMKGCTARFRPGYKLAKQLKAMDIGISDININESNSWFDDIEVSGYKLRFKIVRLGRTVIYNQWERMLDEAAGKPSKDAGDAVSIIMSRPFLIFVGEEPTEGFMKEKLQVHLDEVREIVFRKKDK